MRISEKTVSQIYDGDILKIAQYYTDNGMRKAGPDYKGLSPLTTEKTPSFIYTPRKNIWKCFSTGTGGKDPVSLVIACQNLPYREALIKAAEILGVEVEYDSDGENDALIDEIYAVNSRAARFFQRRLTENETAQNYIKVRGYEWENGVLPEYGVGFSGAKDELSRAALFVGFSREILIKAGLSVEKNGELIDEFRNRIMFPYLTSGGRVCGFIGRSIDGSNPKYLNSHASLVFDKSRALFGLRQFYQQKKKVERVWLVEGQFNVTRLATIGEVAIASSGTSFSDGQAKALQKLNTPIVLAFDADRAGFSAAKKAAYNLLIRGVDLRVFVPPPGTEGKDIDDIFRDNPAAEYQTPGYIEHLISLCEGESAELNQRIKDAASAIKCVRDLIVAEIYIKQLHDKTEITKEALRAVKPPVEIDVEAKPLEINSHKKTCEFALIYAVIHGAETPYVDGQNIREHFIYMFTNQSFDCETAEKLRAKICKNEEVKQSDCVVFDDITKLLSIKLFNPPPKISPRWETVGKLPKYDFASDYDRSAKRYFIEYFTKLSAENAQIIKRAEAEGKDYEKALQNQVKLNKLRIELWKIMDKIGGLK